MVIVRDGYVYAGVRMEMKPGVLYTMAELEGLFAGTVTNDADGAREAVEAMMADGLISVHSRRYYLTPDGIAYQ